MATNYSARGHEGKVRYATRKIAKKKAIQLEHANRDDRHVSVYRCGVCDGYHMGHNNQHGLITLIDYMPNRQLLFADFERAI